jgi:DNA polymerase-3 subunit alpha
MSKLSVKDFVHLHNHTHYSLLDGLQKLGPMIETVKELGMESIAITDHGTMSGALSFYKTAKAEGIRPIIGMETYIAPRKHTDKDPGVDKSPFHLIILAMNNQGYKNLMKLSTIANLEGFYYKPRIDHELLEKYNEGLIVLSGCIGSEVGSNLRNGQTDKADEIITWYKKVFGDRYYLEVQDHGHMWAEQANVNKQILDMSKKHDVKAVVTADAHYLKHEDQEAHEVLLCVQTGSFLSDEKRMSLTATDLHLIDPNDIISRWSETPEVVSNTAEIAKRCDVSITFGKILIPHFDVPTKDSEKRYFEKLVYRGLASRYLDEKDFPVILGELPNPNKKILDFINETDIGEIKKLLTKEIVERVEYEMKVISEMGFNGYFLIVQDFINWGKGQGIIFGPGRGSAAGSIVSYALRITDLDPLQYDLLFERFLNPDRISMPDIDIDIQDSRRDEVIKYCVEKYGKERVAHIVTFGTMAARNAIRDVARVLEVPYSEADRLSKMVPPPIQGRHIPLATSIKQDKALKKEYHSNESSKRVIDLAIKMEGTIRSHGVHAAGVVIAPEDIVNYSPLEMAQKGVVATQYAMGPVEDLGLLKMDFLGLSNLTTINNSLKTIKAFYDVDIDILKLPLDDEKTYELLGRGDTTGVFQLESGGMKKYLRQLKPTVFEDIIAMGALYRPGPLTAGLTQKFIDRKNGLEEVKFAHPSMEPALKTTYGVLVYQEQVMQLAVDMAGLSGGESDTLRKAVGKKQREILAKMKKQFIDGAKKKNGVSDKVLKEFWKELEGFADYAFNKSHAACYGMISYWTAYLKAHYPAAFMAALMTNDYNNTDRLSIDISEARKIDLQVLQPDVNESFGEFSIVKDTGGEYTIIRYGLNAVKNVGTGVVEEIIKARQLDGPFRSVSDFASRVSPRIVNKKALDSLARSGAFDSLDLDRSTLVHNLENLLKAAQSMHKAKLAGQTDLFSGGSSTSTSIQIDFASTNEISQKEQLSWERELLGIYLSNHPLDSYRNYLHNNTTPSTALDHTMDEEVRRIGGVISDIRVVVTKKGAKMAFMQLEDEGGSCEVIVFPKQFAFSALKLVPDNVVVIKGTVSATERDGSKSDEIKLIAEEIAVLELDDVNDEKQDSSGPQEVESLSTASHKKSVEASEQLNENPKTNTSKVPTLYVQLTDPDNEQKLSLIKQYSSKFPGRSPMILVIDRVDRQAIRMPFKIEPVPEFVRLLRELYGESAVVVKP